MVPEESSKPRRRGKSRAVSSADERAASAAVVPLSLEAVIEHERIQLMQIQAMLKCLYQVLLYADDDDSIMHADVANVAARLLNDSVARLDLLRQRCSQPPIGDAHVESSNEDVDPVPPGHPQVRELPALYLC
jgi:hypothetical protein